MGKTRKGDFLTQCKSKDQLLRFNSIFLQTRSIQLAIWPVHYSKNLKSNETQQLVTGQTTLNAEKLDRHLISLRR